MSTARPVAAVISFVDVGNAEDTQCGPVLAGARTAAQREADGGKVKNLGSGKTAQVKEEPKKKKKFLGIF